MLKNIFKILVIFLLGVGGGIFADQILSIYFNPVYPVRNGISNVVYVTEKKEVIVQENTALKLAIEKVEKTVIGVKAENQEGLILAGSGLIVASDGLIVTLAELVPQGAKFSFFIGGKPVSFQILKRDLAANLALVKVGVASLPTVGFANLENLKLGERVFLVGTGAVDELRSSSRFANARVVNEGIIRSFDENLIETNISEDITLAGSPLFNIEGEVVGINMIDSEGKVITIPISKIKTFVGF